MGPAIDSLRPAVGVTGRNPAFLAAALGTLVVSGAASLVAGRIPVVGELVHSLLVTPAVTALLLGMAAAGLATDAAVLGDGVETLRSSYRSLVGAYAVLIAGVLVVVVAWAIEVAVLIQLGPGIDRADVLSDPARATVLARGPILVVTFLAVALALVVGLSVQFFDVAIVVGGESAVSSFGVSWRLFRDAPASVIGYSALRMVPVVGAGVVVAAGHRVGASLAGPIGGILFALLAAAAVGPVTFAFVTAYHVAYYDRRAGAGSEGTDRVGG